MSATSSAQTACSNRSSRSAKNTSAGSILVPAGVRLSGAVYSRRRDVHGARYPMLAAAAGSPWLLKCSGFWLLSPWSACMHWKSGLTFTSWGLRHPAPQLHSMRYSSTRGHSLWWKACGLWWRCGVGCRPVIGTNPSANGLDIGPSLCSDSPNDSVVGRNRLQQLFQLLDCRHRLPLLISSVGVSGSLP